MFAQNLQNLILSNCFGCGDLLRTTIDNKEGPVIISGESHLFSDLRSEDVVFFDVEIYSVVLEDVETFITLNSFRDSN
jgi:hypothetical protein